MAVFSISTRDWKNPPLFATFELAKAWAIHWVQKGVIECEQRLAMECGLLALTQPGIVKGDTISEFVEIRDNYIIELMMPPET